MSKFIRFLVALILLMGALFIAAKNGEKYAFENGYTYLVTDVQATESTKHGLAVRITVQDAEGNTYEAHTNSNKEAGDYICAQNITIILKGN